MKIKKNEIFPTVTGEVFSFMQSHSVAGSWSTEIALTSCEYCNVCDSLCKATSGWSTCAPRLYCEHMFYSCWHNVYGDQKGCEDRIPIHMKGGRSLMTTHPHLVSTVYPDQATAASCTHSYRKPHAASCNYQGITCTQMPASINVIDPKLQNAPLELKEFLTCLLCRFGGRAFPFDQAFARKHSQSPKQPYPLRSSILGHFRGDIAVRKSI
ncbi:uncharacterized protein LOC119596726 [Penaeus monodon]|uniref:uncharacterized protein LOC119596726 n=1 Tax=Penaeus monodon TaxID=6687 RepID=UPI0018A72E5D|nr:uncharacterized protein LOC119596726 [Penaeus monodon]